MNIQFRDLIKNAPISPGIYKMYNSEDELLYVGKAKNLSKRLHQYVDISKLEPHKQIMRSMVTSIKWEITQTETDALILEQKLIKTLKPKYNLVLTDGKMYPFLAITQHTYPRLLKTRNITNKKTKLFGPYPSVENLKHTINIIQKICQLRTCNDTFMRNRSKPCLLYQIGRCSAPCCIQQTEYDNNVKLAYKILSGQIESVITELSQQMKIYAQKRNFEMAATLRDNIKLLTEQKTCIRDKQPYTQNIQWDKSVSDLQNILHNKFNHIAVFDNSHIFGKSPVGAMIAFNNKGFIKSSYRHFRLRNKTFAGNDIAMMQEFISRAIQDIPNIDLIIVDGGKAQWNIAKTVTPNNIPVLGITKGIVRNGDEHFIMPNGEENFSIPKDSNLFLLLRLVRDEAHRFVINYHRSIRSKTMIKSCLDDIEGIGPVRKKQLLQRYGSVQGIMNATLQSLYKTPSLGKNIAKKIYDYFHPNVI